MSGCSRSVFGEQAQLPVLLLLLIEDFQCFAPRCLLTVVDLTQIQDPALRHLSRLQPAALHHAVVVMLFAILHPFVAAQKHAPLQHARKLMV
jgi:hypothetical protein